MPEPVDWSAWHDPYADPGSPLARRLALVQGHIRSSLDASPDRALRVLSVCAGDGRDLIGVLAGRAGAPRVRATLVELDPRNVERARARVPDGVHAEVAIREEDAGLTDASSGRARRPRAALRDLRQRRG